MQGTHLMESNQRDPNLSICKRLEATIGGEKGLMDMAAMCSSAQLFATTVAMGCPDNAAKEEAIDLIVQAMGKVCECIRQGGSDE